ncbi:UbiA family prenyltransferase [Salinibaculum rarum]|uniref:UbiA family prenyltransferase n=1 Tax=Salinibaculum rarum TaxID=3058903 RepID=UPI00265F1E8D|nr:UbiA family prenyltransferase [Salinibaculum sp. KK48]
MRRHTVAGLFLKLNIWLVLQSMLLVTASTLALGVPLSDVGLALLLPPLLFYFIYVEDRRDVSPEDRINNPERVALVKSNHRFLLLTEISALVSYEAILTWFIYIDSGAPLAEFSLFILGQAPFVILLFYEQLKEYFPAVDSVAVATTWAFAVLYPVFLTTPKSFTTQSVALFFAWFLIVFAGVESRNIQDLEGDKEADRSTLAAKIGASQTRFLEIGLKFGGIALISFLTPTLFAVVLVVVHLGLLHAFRKVSQNFELKASDAMVSP